MAKKNFLNKKRILILFLCVLLSFVFSFWVSGLLYDEQIAKIISYPFLFLFTFLILCLLFFIFFVLLKIISDRLKQKTGSIIQFRIIFIFFISNTIIFIIVFILINFIFKVTFDIYLDSNYIQEVKNKRKDYQKIIQEELQKIEQKLKKVVKGEINISRKDRIGGIIVYKKNEVDYFLKASWINKSPSFRVDFLDTISENNTYSSYAPKEGYLYSIYKMKKNDIPFTYIVYRYVPDFFKNNMLESNSEINKIKSIQTTKKYIGIISTVAFGSIYFILFGLTITFFYFYSKNYFISITEIINASKKVSEGKYDTVVSRSKKDEIKKLVDSFMFMVNKIRENQQRLNRLSELEAWRKAVIYISHEIKNPLTPITLSIDYIKNKNIEQSFENYFELDGKFNLIYQKLDLIRNLLSDFSSLVKPKEIEKTKIKADVFLKKFESYLSLYKEIKSKFAISFKEDLVIDIEKISQVINNLLKNSIESIQEKKNLKNPQIKISCYQKEQKILITVKDNGLGIENKKEMNVFQPYFTSKKKGMGLGLAICEKIINEHNGKIFFKSDVEYTEFFIELPI